MGPLISIVIPVYNVEDYLTECIDSIFDQISDECEVVLVDDGSTDSSGLICDRYTNTKNFVVIHKTNGGLGSARNVGLQISSGKYVCFLDSDDRMAPESIQKVLAHIKENDFDICFMKAVKFFPDGKKEDLGDDITIKDVQNKSKKDIISQLVKKNKYPGSSCTKVFNIGFLKKNNLLFSWEKVYAEDLIFVLKAIYYSTTLYSMDFDYYEYRQNREGSITSKTTIKSMDGLVKFIDDAIGFLTVEKKPINGIAKSLMSYVSYEYAILLYAFALYDGKKDNYQASLKSRAWVLKYAKSNRIKAIRVLVFLFGIKFSSRLISSVKK